MGIEYIYRKRYVAKLPVLIALLLVGSIINPVAQAESSNSIQAHTSKEQLDQIIERLSATEIFKADFQQTRVIKQLLKPIESKGRIISVKSQGVYWQTQEPFESELLISPKGVWQRAAGQSVEFKKIKSDRSLEGFIKVMLGIFSGDFSDFSRAFDIKIELQGAKWQMQLTPSLSQIAKYVAALKIEGQEQVSSLEIIESGGDSSKLTFLTDVSSENKLSAEEADYFEKIK